MIFYCLDQVKNKREGEREARKLGGGEGKRLVQTGENPFPVSSGSDPIG
jgi:hypothetical protein